MKIHKTLISLYAPCIGNNKNIKAHKIMKTRLSDNVKSRLKNNNKITQHYTGQHLLF